MSNIAIEYATIGGARLAVTNRDRDNNAFTLVVSYVDASRYVSIATDYNMVATLGGVPLSVSLHTDPGTDPSVSQNIMFYALDIIEDTENEDPEINVNPSEIGSINIPTDPSDRTFTWNGNRLSASKKSDRYYINRVNSGGVAEITKLFTLMGVPMGQGLQDELVLNKTSYVLSDIEEYVVVRIGGSPLTAGRIGSNYYLIVSPIENIS